MEISAPIDSIEYWFAERGKNVRFPQTVHFYPDGSLRRGTPTSTTRNSMWYSGPLRSGGGCRGYPNEAGVLRKALDLINQPGRRPPRMPELQGARLILRGQMH